MVTLPTGCPPIIRIGTRTSRLAVVQAMEVKNRLLGAFPELDQDRIEIVKILTTGDQIQDRSLADIGGKGLFTKEIEQQLADGSIDMAVHSMKDMPDTYPDGLAIPCILERELPQDAFLHKDHVMPKDLPAGTRIGSCAIRRIVQFKAQYPHVEIVPMRGNVMTRLRKMKQGEVDGLLLAYAGLKRLDRLSDITKILDEIQMVPAIAQGAIGVECVVGNAPIEAMLSRINHTPSRLRVKAERGVLKAVAGNCSTPLGAVAHITPDNTLTLTAMLASEDGSQIVTEQAKEVITDDEAAQKLGIALGTKLLTQIH